MPLHPAVYADLLGKKIDEHDVAVWLVNTGWTGGPYGVGERFKIAHSRAVIKAAIEGDLDTVEYKDHPIFRFAGRTRRPTTPRPKNWPACSTKTSKSSLQKRERRSLPPARLPHRAGTPGLMGANPVGDCGPGSVALPRWNAP